MSEVTAIRWLGNELSLLDQRLLPLEEIWIGYHSVEGVYEAIRDMVVRGAPAIGIAAAYGTVFAVKESIPEGELASTPIAEASLNAWCKLFESKLAKLASSRPTAVNLFWALDKVKRVVASVKHSAATWGELLEEVVIIAEDIHINDVADNKKMGQLGAALIIDSLGESETVSVLTHCNAGALATGGYGTALGVVRSLSGTGCLETVYADETRPWLQGARLTAWELQKEGINTILNTDGAAAYLMKTKNIRWVIVGADRITANGDVANKIGTYSLAVLARYHNIKVMVVAPSSTIDMSLLSGDSIPIEQRDALELTHWQGVQITPTGINACNPVFDVTPAELVDVIVTEKGIVEKPGLEKMQQLMAG